MYLVAWATGRKVDNGEPFQVDDGLLQNCTNSTSVWENTIRGATSLGVSAT